MDNPRESQTDKRGYAYPRRARVVAWAWWALCCLVLSLATRPVTADDTWPTLTTHNGLASNPALSLVYTSDGALWMGGVAGVTRWDGRQAQVWTQADGLGDDWVTALAVADGAVWAGTYGGGLSRFDPGHADRPWRTLTTTQGLPGRHVTALATAPDGTLWVGTYGGGLATVRGDQIKPVASSLPSPWITTLTVTNANEVWVGTSGEGVARFNGQTWTVYTKELPDPFVRSLISDKTGNVYVGTGLGLAVWDGNTWRTVSRVDGLPDRRILALAVDAGGVVWAGTAAGLARRDGPRWQTVPLEKLPNSYILALAAPLGTASPRLAIATTAGVALMESAPLPPPPTHLPVLFVHGWRGLPFTTLYNSEARFLKRWLDERGQFSAYVPGVDSNKTLYDNALRLRDYIAEVRQQTGAPKVHLIGHSMGGLTSRAYLESALYQDDVASLTTLGSPHNGAVQWREYLVREVSRGSREPSTRELLPEHVEMLNRFGQKPADVPYYLLGGDITGREGLDWLRFWPPTDGVVSLWSALSLPGPGVTPIETADLHGWATGSVAAGLPAYLWPADNYRAVLRDILSGRPPAEYKTGSRPLVRPVEPPRSAVYTGQLAPGVTRTHQLTLDSVAGVRVIAIWERGTVTTTLTSPAGTVYRQADDKDVRYFGFKFDTFANMAVYKVDRPQPGVWTMSVQMARTATGSDYAVYTELDSPLGLRVETGARVYPPGAPIRVTATLSQAARARNATVTAELYSDGRAGPEVTLVDDGTAGDGVAGDGVYNGVLTAPTEPEYYAIFVKARGANGAFERTASAIVMVRSDRGRITGPATVLPDRDGIQVNIPLAIQTAGPFAVAVRVQANGQEYRTIMPQTLPQGQQIVTVPAPGAPVTATVTEVTLIDNTTAMIPIDHRP